MTEAAWDEISSSMADGIRAMPIICDNPNWWVVKIIDGFGPHTSSLKAMEIYHSRKILLLKEEGDASHVNQSYDRARAAPAVPTSPRPGSPRPAPPQPVVRSCAPLLCQPLLALPRPTLSPSLPLAEKVAKEDKRHMRSALAFLRATSTLTKAVVDGWQLVLVGLACVRDLKSETWIESFKAVNLHPHHRVPFEDWCKRIAHHLQGGQSFKSEKVLDTYLMLPSFWHGMEIAEKKSAVSILATHEGKYSVACVRELHMKLHVPLSEMQNLRVCLELAEENPSHLERGVPDKPVGEEPAAVTSAKAGLADINEGLNSFLLHPKKDNGEHLLTGMAKFDHLIKLARRSIPDTQAVNFCPPLLPLLPLLRLALLAAPPPPSAPLPQPHLHSSRPRSQLRC